MASTPHACARYSGCSDPGGPALLGGERDDGQHQILCRYYEHMRRDLYPGQWLYQHHQRRRHTDADSASAENANSHADQRHNPHADAYTN